MTNNEKIFRNGTVRRVKKLEVLTFSLGPVGMLKTLQGVFERVGDTVKVYSRESPSKGIVYPNKYIVVVRLFGGKIFENGNYHIDILTPEEAEEEIKNSISYNRLLTAEQIKELKPLFDAAGKEVRGCITPMEIQRVFEITPEMQIDTCYNLWNERTPCPIEVGDVFVIAFEKTFSGYRIRKEEFSKTYAFVP